MYNAVLFSSINSLTYSPFQQANEIAFINSLEAQNKRLDILSKHQESEARLQDLQVSN